LFIRVSGFFLSPPKYSEALSYPTTDQVTLASKTAGPPSLFTLSEILAERSSNFHEIDPDETGYSDFTNNYFHNSSTFGSKLNVTKSDTSKPLCHLEAIPETLASAERTAGDKTYAQLEAVLAGKVRVEGEGSDVRKERDGLPLGGQAMCGTGSGGCDRLAQVSAGMNHCSAELPGGVAGSSKRSTTPINGLITPDKMVVESLLSDINGDGLLVNGDISDNDDSADTDEDVSVNICEDLPPPPKEVLEMYTIDDEEVDTQKDLHHIAEALSREHVHHRDCDSPGEHVPLLHPADAHSNYPKDKHGLDGHHEQSCKFMMELDSACADEGYSDTSKIDFSENISPHSSKSVGDPLIFSAQEYSTSDLSIHASGDLTSKSAIDMCQRTLKRTNNGADHTVYELSPSDSFCNSTDNVQDESRKLQETSSNEAICRIGRSNSSLSESKRKHNLSRDTSVSFKKPLVVGPKVAEKRTSGGEVQPAEPEVESGDGEPFVSPRPANSITSIPSNIVSIHTWLCE